MNKNPIYITINDKQPLDHTTDYTNYIIDYDKKGRVIGIKVVDYKQILLNGKRIDTGG